MVCNRCGHKMEDGTRFCTSCGNNLTEVGSQNFYSQPVKHDVPKCTCCGYVGPWKKGPLFRPVDIIIGIALLILGVIPGIVYLGVVAAIRASGDRREKICPKCKAKNMWTFMY